MAARQSKSQHVLTARTGGKRASEMSASEAKVEPPRKRAKRASGSDRRTDLLEESQIAVVSFPPNQTSLSVSFAPLRAGLLPLGCQPKDEDFKSSVMRDLVGSQGLQDDDFRVLKL